MDSHRRDDTQPPRTARGIYFFRAALSRIGADRAAQEKLRAVVLGHDRQVVEPRAGKLLLGQDVFEHFADGKCAALARELEGLLRGIEGGADMGELFLQRMDERVRLDDLTRDFLAQLVALDRRAALPGIGEMRAGRIEKSARPDPPREADAVVHRRVE